MGVIMMDKLKLIDTQVKNCNLCNDMVEKFNNNTTVSFGRKSNILIVGEAPANNGWRKSGIAWYDVNQKLLPSGKVLQKLLDIINIRLEDTTFIEAIKCYPKDRKYLSECSKNSKKILDEQIKILNPDIILLLGDSATKAALGLNYKKYSDIVGNNIIKKIGNKNTIIIPIYHPSPISPKSYKGNVDIFTKIKQQIIIN
jgi:uracil-DNA glycosylase family 4